MDNGIFAFTLTTKQGYFEKGDCVFFDDGGIVGRVLRQLKVDINPDNVFYSYDIEASREYFNALEQREKHLYRVKDYSVSSCSTHYIHIDGGKH